MKVFNGYIDNNKIQIPQYFHFRCGMTHLNYLSKKLGKTFRLQEEWLKTEMNQDEVNGNNYNDKKDEWIDYVEQDVFCIVFSYAIFGKTKEKNWIFKERLFVSACIGLQNF